MGFWSENIFTKRNKQENVDEIEVRSGNMANYNKEGLFTTGSDEVIVDENSVQTIPSVVSCIELITGTIAQLPIHLYKEGKDNRVEKIQDDYRLFFLNNEANENLSSFNFKKSITRDFLLNGRTHSYIERKGNEVTGLYVLPSNKVTMKKYLNQLGYKYDVEYEYNTEGKKLILKPYDTLSILRDTNDGFNSVGILKQGEDIFRLALNENRYSTNILTQGALPIGILETAGRLSKEAATKLSESWKRLYTGSKNAGKTVVLEEGITYKPLSLSPSDLNLNDSKKFSSEEICRLFNVPPSLVLGEKGYGNMEQDNLHFTKYCLSTIISTMESELDKALLLEDEKEQGYYFRFDLNEILRSTEVEKYTSIEKGMKSGIMSINEARYKLDLEPLEKDYIMFSLGNVFYDKDKKEFVVPNMGQTMGENKNVNIKDINNDEKEVQKDDGKDNTDNNKNV